MENQIGDGEIMVYLPKEYKNLYPAEKKHKYNAVPLVIDGHKFPSTKEAKRYQELKLQEHCGVISELKIQPKKFVLQEGFRNKNFKRKFSAITYTPDFFYIKNGESIYEDCKGFKTPVYRNVLKMFLKQCPNLTFIET